METSQFQQGGDGVDRLEIEIKSSGNFRDLKALIHENDDLPDCDKLYPSLIFEASGSFVDVLLAKKVLLYVENSDKHKCQKYPRETHI